MTMIRIFPDMEALSIATAQLFAQKARHALAKGRFSVALSGGQTPQRTYELLTSSPLMDGIPWKIVHFFWGDERWVPPHDPLSNERMAREFLLDHIPVPEDQIHPIYRPDVTAHEGAKIYEQFLRDFFAGEKQLFDLVFLGLGENGHTASLFPHTPILQEQEHWVAEVYLPNQDLFRVSLTAPAINRASEVAFLVNGSNKAEILHQVLEGPRQVDRWPAQLIQPVSGELVWIADQAAAQDLAEPNDLVSGQLGLIPSEQRGC